MRRPGLPLAAALLALGAPAAPAAEENPYADADPMENHRRAIMGWAGAGLAGAPFVSGLIRDVGGADPDIRWRAEFAIGRIGVAAVPPLVEALKSPDAAIRESSAYVLGTIGPRARGAAPALLEAAKDPEPDVRLWSVKSLGEIDPEPLASVAAFAAALGDESADMRRVAVTILVKLGPKGAAAVPALVGVLKDADAGIRWRACIALRQMGPEAKEAVTALVGLLADEDGDVRARAAQALGRIGPAAVPALAKALESGDLRVRRAAAGLLGPLGVDAKSVRKALETMASSDADPGARRAAADALRQIPE